MYPTGELSALETRKIALRSRIAAERWQFGDAAERVMRPLAWIDRMRARWRGVSPLTKLALVPLVLALRSRLFPRVQVAAGLLRWGLRLAAKKARRG